MPVAIAAALPRPAAQQSPPPQAAAPPYIPQAKFCANGGNGLCAIVPAYIGPDPGLKQTQGYNGLYGQPPQSETADVQSPFDNMAWQMFVALNWAADSVKQPAPQGLTQPGRRVWQTYPKVSSLFGNAPVIAGCTQALALPIFHIGSNGQGQPMPNNEEYLQAATNKPLIDINGNWTLFERRVNEVEAQYLRAPGGQKLQTLTTKAGQLNFIKHNRGGAEFTSSATVPDGANGAIEIKASWRIHDPAKDDPARFFTQNILLAVSGDLVRGGRPFCRSVRVGLVGMHILERNPLDKINPALRPQWIWATFEHVDNAPLAAAPCNVADGCGTDKATNWINQPSCGPADPAPGAHFSFFNTGAAPGSGTNVSPQPPAAPRRHSRGIRASHMRRAVRPARLRCRRRCAAGASTRPRACSTSNGGGHCARSRACSRTTC
ncbi:hypothetical protein IVB18_23185 [Bradyrhizobium sp. 186]|uniref:hypothetical protein n=1 Tax=Bradyrhizobium sp. 186 TaxID=2782654 RepID=UPI002000F7FB|nr:hypothetical protein [Bradyrhizobium sp. 186]UPK39875.1 hypothetical protein IVB18_23185 [Bradyrhizobium sp. 186]